MEEEYFEIDSPKIENQIYFKSYIEFEKILTRINPSIKYTWTGKGGFTVGFVYEGVMYCLIVPKRFPSLKTYIEAENEGFKGNYSDWMEIKKQMEEGGYGSYRDLEKDRGDLSIEEWLKLMKIGFGAPEEVHEAERMDFIYLGERDFSHRGEHHPVWWGTFTEAELNDFREAKKSGFKDKTEFLRATA